MTCFPRTEGRPGEGAKTSSRLGHVAGAALAMLNWFELSCWPVCTSQMEGSVNKYPVGQHKNAFIYH